MHRGGRPALLRPASSRDAVRVQPLDDPALRAPANKLFEDAQNHLGLPSVDRHLVALWSRSPLLVHPGLADGDGPIAVGRLPDDEAALFLAELAPQRLLPQVQQLQLVEDPPHLNPHSGVLVVRVQTVGH